MSWDPLQREVLEALGHVVYVQAGAGAPMAEPVPVVTAVPVERPVARQTGRDADAALRALLRAAGRDAGDAAAVALCSSLLAGGSPDAAARRAFWPQLRALRAASRR